MKSDYIQVSSRGEGLREALEQTEAVARFEKLTPRQAIHLRLLTEETMGMFMGILEDVRGRFWIESEDGDYAIHLLAWTMMDAEKRKKLLSVSTSGSNAAAKGVLGKIRDLFLRSLEPIDGTAATAYQAGWIENQAGIPDGDPAIPLTWSFVRYKASVDPKDPDRTEEWDELEKSVVANVADDVEIFIRAEEAEMVVHKRFND